MQDSYSQDFHPSFKKDLKDLDKPLRQKIFDLLDDIAKDPNIGKKLSGNLKDIYSYHFGYASSEYRIAYTVIDTEVVIFFIGIGTRENFYDKLQRRVKK